MATTESKPRVITLTNAPSVRIYDAQWPLLAQASLPPRPPALGDVTCCWLKVRQHADGRAIVYGGLDSYENGCHRELRGGEVVAAGVDLVAVLRRVSATVEAGPCLGACISALPPVEL